MRTRPRGLDSLPGVRQAHRALSRACTLLLSVSAIAGTGDALHAQSRQRISVQGSGQFVAATKDYGTTLPKNAKLGFEGQLRLTGNRFSIGAGYQRSTVFRSTAAGVTGTLSLAFVEPRYVVVLLGESAALYAAGRVGYGRLMIRSTPRVSQNSTTYGGGLGVLVGLTPRVAVDIGGQYFVADFGGGGGSAGYVLARLGLAVGLF